MVFKASIIAIAIAIFTSVLFKNRPQRIYPHDAASGFSNLMRGLKNSRENSPWLHEMLDQLLKNGKWRDRNIESFYGKVFYCVLSTTVFFNLYIVDYFGHWCF